MARGKINKYTTNNMLIRCSCGCGLFRLKYDKNGREKTYIHGHNNKGTHMTTKTKIKLGESISKTKNEQFKKGILKIWNKGSSGLMKAWNKGLNKDTDDRVKGYGKKLKGLKRSESYIKKVKGKHRSPKTEFKNGIEHPNWNGGSSFEPYDKNFTSKFKRAIRKRDNQICMLCSIHREKLKMALHVHHVDYNKLLSIPQNCVSLCNSCHTKTNINREHWKIFFQSILSKRYGYQYSENNEIKIELINTN